MPETSVRSAIIDPAAGPDDPTRKFPDPPLASGMLTDMAKYFDPEHARHEFERLFARTWLIAGRESDLKAPGDWFRFDIGGESLILVRTTDGTIKGHYNVCQHRGAQLVDEDFGTAKTFVCGFHSWAWNLDGSLNRIKDEDSFDPSLVCDRPGLAPVHVATWAGFVFVSMAQDPPALEDYLCGVPEQLGTYRIEDMVVVADLCVEWRANWKIAMDAFMEGYHIHRRHPEGLAWIDDVNLQHDLFGNGHSRMILPVSVKSPRMQDQDSLSDELREMLREVGLDPAEFEGRAGEVRAAIQRRKPEWAAEYGMDYSGFSPSQLTDDWNYFLFPNATFNIHPEGILFMRFRPHPTDVEKCFYDVWILARRVNDPQYRLPRYMGAPDIDLSGEVPRPARVRMRHGDASLGQVLDQDAAFVPRVQAGVRSRSFRGVRLSHQERRLRAFYQEYDRYLKEDAS